MSAQPAQRGRVLIIDDQRDILEGMKALMEIEGIDVTTHDSLITLPFMIREADPDVILLDISLPALSGSALFRNGSQRLLRTDASIILFSGRPAGELAMLAKDLGAHGYVTKSEDSLAIVARVQGWIQERRALRAAKGNEAPNVALRTASLLTR
jgi:DNA-binding response OmpR family regulator